MTPTLSHLAALSIGFLAATLIIWSVHRKQQQDWQKEYRRLMGGIKKALNMSLIAGWVNPDGSATKTPPVTEFLKKLYNGEE